MEKVIIVVALIKDKGIGRIYDFPTPFADRKEAKKFADKIRKYWSKRARFEVTIKVHNAIKVR